MIVLYITGYLNLVKNFFSVKLHYCLSYLTLHKEMVRRKRNLYAAKKYTIHSSVIPDKTVNHTQLPCAKYYPSYLSFVIVKHATKKPDVCKKNL